MKTKTRTLKTLVTIVTALLLIIGTTLPIFATDVMPIYEHCNYCTFEFWITNGTATVGVNYDGDTRTFTNIIVTAKIQKKVLGLFWKTVDINWADDEWTAVSSQPHGYLSETFSISETGTYRAVFEVQFYGTTNDVDVLNETVQYKYS